MAEPTEPTTPRHPDVVVQLTGASGNAFYILGAVKRALRRAGVPLGDVNLFLDDATSNDYDHLLDTVQRWVTVE